MVRSLLVIIYFQREQLPDYPKPVLQIIKYTVQSRPKWLECKPHIHLVICILPTMATSTMNYSDTGSVILAPNIFLPQVKFNDFTYGC